MRDISFKMKGKDLGLFPAGSGPGHSATPTLTPKLCVQQPVGALTLSSPGEVRLHPTATELRILNTVTQTDGPARSTLYLPLERPSSTFQNLSLLA